MCGRVVQKTPLAEIRVLCETVNPVPNAAATYNGAPTQNLAIVRLDAEGRRSLDLMRWGLVPSWAKDKAIGPRLINAMAETVATKPAFRDAAAAASCRWISSTSGKRPGAASRPAASRPAASNPMR